MPFLKGLSERGRRALMQSTLPANTPAAWTAFQTGLPPAKSGVYDFRRWNRTTRREELIDSRALPRTIWEVAGDHDRRVGFLNLPLTFPPFPVNGFSISGFTTPGPDADWTRPRSLKADLLEAVPDYEIVLDKKVNSYRPAKDLEGALDYMSGLVQQRTAASEYLLGRFDLDLYMVHFHASDFMQHSGWAFLDPDHELYEPEKNERIFRRLYARLDDGMRRVVEAFDARSDRPFSLFVVSDHGFEAHERTFYLGNWLGGGRPGLRRKIANRCRRGVMKLLNFVARVDTLNLRKALLPKRARRAVADRAFRPGESGKKPRPVALARGLAGEAFLFLNTDSPEAREAWGGLKERLLRITDPETGRRPIRQIHDVPSGYDPQWMPDRIVEPAEGYALVGDRRLNKPIFEGVDAREQYQAGKHHRDGIFVAVDEDAEYPDRIPIERMAGIVLNRLGVPPEGLGEPVERDRAVSEKEQAAVRKTLEQLGYMS